MNLPIGSIILWTSTNIPDGWQVCNGTNGTPNLIDKFVRGANNDTDLLGTGGADTHVHTNPNTDSRATHTHTGISGTSGGPGVNNIYGGSTENVAGPSHTHSIDTSVVAADSHAHTVGNVNAGSSLPLHKTLVYIMRMV